MSHHPEQRKQRQRQQRGRRQRQRLRNPPRRDQDPHRHRRHPRLRQRVLTTRRSARESKPAPPIPARETARPTPGSKPAPPLQSLPISGTSTKGCDLPPFCCSDIALSSPVRHGRSGKVCLYPLYRTFEHTIQTELKRPSCDELYRPPYPALLHPLYLAVRRVILSND